MRVFLSWSGGQSHSVACALKEWLPDVVQTLDTWVSSADIDKGESWFSAISESLVKAEGMGVFCLTPDNLNAPWLAYEAGALASHDKGKVATFLYGVSAADVAPPLGLFQATVSSSKADVLLLVKTMNNRLTTPLPENRLQKAFETHWPSLESQLTAIPARPQDIQKQPVQEATDTLNEILAVVRRIEKDSSGRWDSGPLLNPPSIPTGLLGTGMKFGLMNTPPAAVQGESSEKLNSLAEILLRINDKNKEDESQKVLERLLIAAAKAKKRLP